MSLQEHILVLFFFSVFSNRRLVHISSAQSQSMSGLILFINQFKLPFPFCGVIPFLLQGCTDPDEQDRLEGGTEEEQNCS